MSDPKFPAIEDVHEVLSDLTKLFEDRNALLDSMFREDKYKDFLLAENIQSLVEADKRDDAAGGKIKKDLANGYEVLKAKTMMQKFANFISPGMLPTLDLSEESDYDDDLTTDEDDFQEQGADRSTTSGGEPEKGEKGDKGDTGDTNLNITAPTDNFDNRLTKPSQNSGIKLAEGGVVPPSPMMNALNPSAQRPEKKSGVKSLESLGLVGEKNVASELVEDLGLDKFKKALAEAMSLPLKAVAAGLAGLLDSIDVPEGGEAITKQVASIGKAFDIPVKQKKEKKSNPIMEFVKSGGITGAIARMILPKKKKSKVTRRETSSSFSMVNGEIVKNESSDSGFQPVENSGGPSLVRSAPGYLGGGVGGATHAPDNISTSGDTKIDAMKNTFSSITQGAKNIFSKTTTGRAFSATTSVLNKLLGGVKPASEGSQYAKQDINSLTNNVINQNEMMMQEKTDITMSGGGAEEGTDITSSLAALSQQMKQFQKVQTPSTVAPTEIKISKYLKHSLIITHGGETIHEG